MVSQQSIQQLISQCDIEEIISGYVQLKRTGRYSKALCPFHSEKTPSFVVYPDTQSFYCFGCGVGGDVISFTMHAENLSYIDAVRFLARRRGIALSDDENDEAAELKAKIYEINKETARFFNKCLKLPIGKSGYDYFKKRELSDKVITAFGLGYAPDGWNNLSDFLKSKGYTEKQLLAACVVQKGKKGGVYDLFRNRVMFPIIDTRGNVIGFGGRVLDDSKPKYLNTPDTPVFKKSRNLFALNFAKTEVKDYIILAEGYMDVIAINAAGFKNTVATLGTALTEEQARIISKYTNEVVISYDSDGPGQAATMRAINIFSDAGIKTRVLEMTDAKDPDEYIKKFGAKRFELLLDSAGDNVMHELGNIKKECDLESVEGKIDYLKRAVGVLSGVKNSIERDVYAAAVAEETSVTIETVKAQTDSLIKKHYRDRERREWRDIETNKELSRDRINPQKQQNLKEALAEEGIIVFLFKNPDYYEKIDAKISESDFVTDFNRRVYAAMRTLHSQSCEVSISLLAPIFTQQETGAISGMLAKSDGQSPSEEMLDDYINVLLKYRERQKRLASDSPEALEEYRKKLKK